MDHCCYILYNHANHKTYVGYTNNIDKRIRQHNGEIKGGARFTSNQVVKGVVWVYLMIISSPTLTKNEALSLEWHIKHKKIIYNGDSCERKFMVVKDVLETPKFNNNLFTIQVQSCFLSKAKEFFKDTNVKLDIL